MNLKKNPELLPLIEWWEKDGKSTVTYALIAIIAICGWYGWKHYKATVKTNAANAIVRAVDTSELEEATAKFAGSNAENALKLRLAKSYYDDGHYEEALVQYDELMALAPNGFEDVPVIGKAHCLEALGRYDEAQKAFDEFAEKNPKHYLTLDAQLGAARSFVEAGNKDRAIARIEAMKVAYKDDKAALDRVESTGKVIKHYEKK